MGFLNISIVMKFIITIPILKHKTNI